MRKAPVALALLLLFSSLAFAAFGDFKNKYGEYFSNRMDSWWGLAISAIMLCLFFNVLVHMAGMALQSEHLKRYARSEFLQVTASSLMIFFAVSFLYIVSSGGAGVSAFDLMNYVLGEGSAVSCAAAPEGVFRIWEDNGDFGPGPMEAFKCKVQEKISALDRAYNNVVQSNMPVERATSICINLFGVPVYCGDWDLALHNEMEQAHLVATKIVSLLMPLHAQFVLAEYIERNMLTVFLPAGLVMRILPLTRGVGGLFIAIAIGFFFVFPTFFLLTDPTFVKQDAPVRDTLQGVCFTGFRGSAVVLNGILSSNALSSQSALATASGAVLVFQITIATLFYPFVAFAVTLIFIRAMTPLLGGDLGELMKMVARLG